MILDDFATSFHDIELADASAAVSAAWLHAWELPPRMDVSEWADAHRKIAKGSGAEPGQWRTDRHPPLREIMDCLSDHSPVRVVDFMKSGQIGATEIGINWTCYVIDRGIDSMIVAQPVKDLARSWAVAKFDPGVLDMPLVLDKLSTDNTFEKQFPGGTLWVIWTNSSKQLRQRTARYIFMDEVDEYPRNLNNQGPAEQQLATRAMSYGERAKIYRACTPTVAGGSAIEAGFLDGDQRHYHVHCPHCGGEQVLDIEHLQPDGTFACAVSRGGFGQGAVVQDEQDTRRQRVADGILARAGILTGDAARAARQDNPAAHQPLYVLAEQSLIAAGVNTRNMDRDQISRMALAQSTGDFPVILENVLHKMLLAAYRLQQFTWSRFCATGSLSDYRPHNRYHLGSFSDLKPVNEEGEYENGVLSDAAKETIQGSRKGRILQITPEVLVNDDLGAFSRPTTVLGQAAARTIEKDVYGLLALNAGLGPLMSDGKTLFHADHGNIAAVAAAPTVASFDAGRQQMGSQMDPGGNDYLDIVPAVWLGPKSLRGAAVVVNEAEFDDEANKNQRRPNISRGLVSDIIDTPRLSGTAWMLFADKDLEPVIEVAFLNGVQTPTLEQETNFRTDGLSWKVVHRYGVGAVGWKGAHRNAGQ